MTNERKQSNLTLRKQLHIGDEKAVLSRIHVVHNGAPAGLPNRH